MAVGHHVLQQTLATDLLRLGGKSLHVFLQGIVSTVLVQGSDQPWRVRRHTFPVSFSLLAMR